ncbi:hypothetical protein [Metallococcus carri]|uniref:hypothetical protein n=1 Tax=Metallococcus carri TaxID=1656884 RepID=UPI001F402F4A|nr:hypothetical protein [Metallococcus carri]
MEITESARRHGVRDADIRHAVRHLLRQWPMDDGFTMIVGPAQDGQLLEIGVNANDVIIHAMRARRKYLEGREQR